LILTLFTAAAWMTDYREGSTRAAIQHDSQQAKKGTIVDGIAGKANANFLA
jgi:hypothetical protein